VEHYEVATYGTAKAIAGQLELSEAVELLSETLTEEEEADKKLTEVAESLYEKVLSESQGESDEDDEKEARLADARPGRSEGLQSAEPVRQSRYFLRGFLLSKVPAVKRERGSASLRVEVL
jgi:hypothetical protein